VCYGAVPCVVVYLAFCVVFSIVTTAGSTSLFGALPACVCAVSHALLLVGGNVPLWVAQISFLSGFVFWLWAAVVSFSCRFVWPALHAVCAGMCLFVCGRQLGLWVGWVHCVCGLGSCMCVLPAAQWVWCLLAAVMRVWWMFEWHCFELVPLVVRGGGYGSHAVTDQAEPQSSTLWQLSESV
jgi:hypothetical protein